MNYESAGQLLAAALCAYAAAGLVFALAFITRGVTRIDEQARGTGMFFRVIILPGSVALWPLLLKRWLRATLTSGGER